MRNALQRTATCYASFVQDNRVEFCQKSILLEQLYKVEKGKMVT